MQARSRQPLQIFGLAVKHLCTSGAFPIPITWQIGNFALCLVQRGALAISDCPLLRVATCKPAHGVPACSGSCLAALMPVTAFYWAPQHLVSAVCASCLSCVGCTCLLERCKRVCEPRASDVRAAKRHWSRARASCAHDRRARSVCIVQGVTNHGESAW